MNTHWYSLAPDALTSMARSVLSREQVAAWAPPGVVDVPPEIRNFVAADGLVTQIPAVRKKRRMVLAWLVHRFDDGRSYSEAEVNKVIRRHHEDCATLRRELVGYRMMTRDAGRYRRLPEAEWTN